VKPDPYVPDHTCPYIDRAVDLINMMAAESNSDWRKTQAKLAIAYMEFLREANEKLRDSSRYWHEVSKNRGRKKS